MLNRVLLIGNLVEEPELRYTPNGTAVGKIRIAVTRTFNRDESDFFNVVTWRKTAENCANYLKKGGQVCVEGRLQTRSYEAQDGSKRWVTEVIADNVHFLGSRQQNQNADTRRPAAPQAGPPGDDSLGEWEKLGREVKSTDLDMFDGKSDDDEIPF